MVRFWKQEEATLSVIYAILALGAVIFLHELGHFLMAKKAGIFVEQFSIGFPPHILTKKIGETIYCIGLIPLGGYVKMDEGSQNSKTVFQRALVVVSGPFMNYLTAIVLMIGLTYYTDQPIFDNERIIVGAVEENLPASTAGLQPEDLIIAMNNEPVSSFDVLQREINSHLNDEVSITWVRAEDTITASMRTFGTVNSLGDSVGIIGFTLKPTSYQETSLSEAIVVGFTAANIYVYETAGFFIELITGKGSLDSVGGPIAIVSIGAGQAEKGLYYLVFFIALISVSLLVVNLLPIPFFDGGHLAFLAIEMLRGKPVPQRVKVMATVIGLAFLGFIFLVITFKDITRLF